MAWYPLGGQGTDGIVKNELLTTIGAKYNKTAAQVALRWLTQRGIVAIPSRAIRSAWRRISTSLTSR